MKKRMYLAVTFVFLTMQITSGQITSGPFEGFKIAGSLSAPVIHVMTNRAAGAAPFYSLEIDGSTLSECVMAALINMPNPSEVELRIDGTLKKYRFNYARTTNTSVKLGGIGFYCVLNQFTLEVIIDANGDGILQDSEKNNPKQFPFDLNEPLQRLKLEYMVARLVKQYPLTIEILEGNEGIYFWRQF